jgi:hypothetical protein
MISDKLRSSSFIFNQENINKRHQNKYFPLNFIVVALSLGRTGTDYFMNNKQDKDLCLLELWCKVEFQHLKSYPYLKKSKQ